MNDYQMSFLAASRRRDLLAEAQQARLARSAKRSSAMATPRRPRPIRRLRIATLLGRMG